MDETMVKEMAQEMAQEMAREIARESARMTLICTKEMLTFDEAVILTGIPKNQMYKLTASRRIPHYKPGGKVYFSRSELERWLRNGRVATMEEIGDEATDYVERNPRPGVAV